MQHVFFFLHVLVAVSVGIYLLMPALVAAMGKLVPQGKIGLLQGLRSVNRLAMYLWLVQLLTGGYLISQYDLSSWWMATVGIVWFAVGAITGIFGGQMKKAVAAIENDWPVEPHLGKIRMWVWINAILTVVIIYLMVFPK